MEDTLEKNILPSIDESNTVEKKQIDPAHITKQEADKQRHIDLGIPYKPKRGRPSKVTKINLKQLEYLYKNGFTQKQCAEFFGVSEESLTLYNKKYPRFYNALKNWKEEADEKVEHCLYKRAIGYEYDEVHYEKIKVGNLNLASKEDPYIDAVKVKVIRKHVSPDTTAQIFWLKNRKREDWKDKPEEKTSDELINAELQFSEVPDNGVGYERFKRFLN